MKKSVKTTATALALVGVLSIGGIMAYFTDADTATNEFTVGRVSIDLVEENWDPDLATQITPLEEFAKDPKVVNDGVNDAFIFMKVDVPYANVTIADQDGTKAPEKAWTELFSYDVNTADWTEVTGEINGVTYPIMDEATGKATHLYAYGSDTEMTALSKEDVETSTLFDYIRFANVVEDEGLEETDLEVVVNAYAIQTTNINDGKIDLDGDNADGQTTPVEVWKVLSNQSSDNVNEEENVANDIFIKFLDYGFADDGSWTHGESTIDFIQRDQEGNPIYTKTFKVDSNGNMEASLKDLPIGYYNIEHSDTGLMRGIDITGPGNYTIELLGG